MKALKKYSEDIDLMIERMKDQSSNMKRFYLDEIITIEVTYFKLIKIEVFQGVITKKKGNLSGYVTIFSYSKIFKCYERDQREFNAEQES